MNGGNGVKKWKDFSDYYDNKIYDKVEARKDKLLRRWKAGESLPLIQVKEQKRTEEEWLEYLGEQYHQAANILEYSAEPPYAAVENSKRKKAFCSAVCVEYFRLYEITRDNTAFRRYTYFEVYYDDKVIACLMDMRTFEKRGNMKALDMDEIEWGNTKHQIKAWWKLFLPEIEEIELAELPENFARRVKAYRKWPGKNEGKFDGTYPNKEIDVLWPLVTYIVSLQMMPVLPQKMMPWYVLNYVCKDDEACDAFTKGLSVWLADFLKNDPIFAGRRVPYGSDIRDDEKVSNLCAVEPYIWTGKRSDKKMQTLQKLQSISERKRCWEKFPFGNRAIILVSKESILSSIVINIPVDDDNLFADGGSSMLRKGFLCRLGHLMRSFPNQDTGEDVSGSQTIEWAQELKEGLGELSRGVRKTIAPDKEERKRLAEQWDLFQLATNFLTFYGEEDSLWEINRDGEAWFLRQKNTWAAKRKNLQDVIPVLLQKLNQDCGNAKNATGEEKKIPDTGLIKEISGRIFLIFDYTQFKKRIEREYPQIPYDDLYEELSEMQIADRNKDKKYKVISLGQSFNTAAFDVEKLSQFE